MLIFGSAKFPIGNISKPPQIPCLPACHVQDNWNQMTFAHFPQRDGFFHQQIFCDVSSHIWQTSCQYHYKGMVFKAKYPNLCTVLESYEEFFGNGSSCLEWPGKFLAKYSQPNDTLIDELYEYGKRNLALVHILIESPYVTKIKRGIAMSFTSYVANTGGLLGLCIGFSFISAIEIFYWCCCCIREFEKKALGRMKATINN